MGPGVNGNVYELMKFDGNLYAGGRNGVDFWNGNTWNPLPHPYGVFAPLTMASYNDTLYIGGDVASWSDSRSRVYKFDGIQWVQVGGEFDEAYWSATKVLLTYNGQLISGGRFETIGQDSIANIAAWNGTQWNSLGDGLNGIVTQLAEHNGKLFTSGNFTSSGADTTIRVIAQWDGASWSALDPNHVFRTAGPMISFNGDLIISTFDTIASIPMKGLAAWDGISFSPMGNDSVRGIGKMLVFNGVLYACGRKQNPWGFDNVLYKWTGTSLEQISVPLSDNILDIDEYSGELVVGGFFEDDFNHVTRMILATGISRSALSADFRIYPNPAQSSLFVNTGKRGHLLIQDNVGSIVLEMNVQKGESRIDLQPLSCGSYFVTISDGALTTCSRLIIVR